MAQQAKASWMRRWLRGTTALTGGMLALTGAALANPQGPVVSAGQATITSKPNEVDVTLGSKNAVINWNSFNISPNETVKFFGTPGGSVLNDVVGGGGASSIFGTISAPGLLFALSNPYGILFGPGAQVSAASVILTTARIGHDDFMAGRYNFSIPGNPNAAVVNQGTITVEQAGIAALVAPGTANSGVINARLSKVALASANTFYLDLYGDQLVSVAADKVMTTAIDANSNPLSAAVEQSGKIIADGGSVQITANVARDVVSSAINLSGVVQAQAISQSGGTIVLAGGDGVVDIASTGLVDATGSGAGQSGGSVSVTGAGLVHNGTIDVSGQVDGGQVAINVHDVLQSGALRADGATGKGGSLSSNFAGFYLATQDSVLSANGGAGGGSVNLAGASGSSLVLSGKASAQSSAGRGGQVALNASEINLLAATVDASGATGGGTIAVGGKGGGAAVAATTTNINGSSTLSADALANGDGGSVTIWSEQQTNVMGALSARGGAGGGNAGSVEVSADPAVATSAVSLGTVPDLSAPNGKAGSLLIDPSKIVISSISGMPPFFQLINPDANAATDGSRFGAWVRTLPGNGNVIVTDPTVPMFGNAFAGAVYLFNGGTGGLISTLAGATANNFAGVNGIGVTTNGNAVVFSGSALGEATFINGTTGLNGAISASNTYISNGAAALANLPGNPSVPCLTGQPALPAATCAGILVNILGNASAFPSPLLAAGANTILGLPPLNNMTFGLLSFVPLPNGSYELFNTLGGTAAFGNPTTGISGVASASNSLTDFVAPVFPGPGGLLSPCLQVPAACGFVGSQSFTALTNGNVVVSSALGASFFNLSGGAVVATNNITNANTLLGAGSVTPLTNGNYVVDTPGALGNLGAVTFGSGTTGVVGAISTANSLIGAAANDLAGSSIDALGSGNYLVLAPSFGGGIGAATLGNGTSGTTGPMSVANSLVGTAVGDSIGSHGAVEAANGNLVLLSPAFAGGAGAATVIAAGSGTHGVVSASNSIVGANAGDGIGNNAVALSNNNFVVLSGAFGGLKGAVTFMTVGTAGVVSAANSLVGGAAGDAIGSLGVTALTNGNYVVKSPDFSGMRGAVTLGNGVSGTSGVVSAANSLVGSIAGDLVGADGNLNTNPTGAVVALANGNYVVATPTWNAGAGAITFGNGVTGVTGPITASNSLIGTAGSALGAPVAIATGMTALMNQTNPVPTPPGTPVATLRTPVFALATGNYVVQSPNAVTFGNGTTGTVGSISPVNSLMGTGVGQGGVFTLPSGNYLVSSPFFGNNQGAVTFGNGTIGTVGSITTANSLIGNPGDVLGFSVLSVPLTGFAGNPTLTSATVYQTLFAQGKLSVPGVGPTAADLTQFGITGPLSIPNSALGAIALLGDGNAVIGSPFAFGGKGSVTFLSENTAITGTLSAQNSVVGTGMGFGTYVHDDPTFGTYVAAAMIGGQNAATGSPVFVSAGVPKGFNTILNGMLPQAGVTLSPQSITTALASGDQLTLQSSGDIVINSPVDLGNGSLFLVADGQIIFNNGLTLDTAFPGRPGARLNFFSQTTNGGLESAILQMTGNFTQPARWQIPRLHIFEPGPYCVTLGSDGSCQAPRTPAEALAARGNVFIGEMGRPKCYFNYSGPPAPAVTDVGAFATCP